MATHGGHSGWTHRNRWQPHSAVILSVDTDGGQTSEWSGVHQQPRLRWHIVRVITINQQQPAPGSVGGRLPPPPSQTEAQTEAGPTASRYAAERPGRGSYFCRPRYYLHHALLPLYLNIILSLSTHIYAYLYTGYCIVRAP